MQTILQRTLELTYLIACRVAALALPILWIWSAILVMLCMLALLFSNWMLLHRRVKLKKPRNRDLELGPSILDTSHETSVLSNGAWQSYQSTNTSVNSSITTANNNEIWMQRQQLEETPKPAMSTTVAESDLPMEICFNDPVVDEDLSKSTSCATPCAKCMEGEGPERGQCRLELDEVTTQIRYWYPLHKASNTGFCVLCANAIDLGQQIRILPCTHSFHNLCLLRHLVLEELACPSCNFQISTN